MRILLANESARAHRGGVNRMVVESCEWLQQAGHTVALAYFDAGPSEVSCRTYPWPNTADASEIAHTVDRVLSDFQPDIIQLHHDAQPPLFPNALADHVPACRFIHDQSWFCSSDNRMARDGTPCHRPHGLSCLFWHYAQGCGGKSPIGNGQRWLRVQHRRSLQRVRYLRIQVASQFMKKGLLENDYPEEQIDVIPLFATRPRASAPTEPGLMLVASRLVKGKGVDFLISALKELPALPWRLAVAGDGPERITLEKLTEELELEKRITFLGELSPPELEKWYARTSLVLSPVLRAEPFGLVGVEAMAHGKPMIAFSGGATEEWLVDGETGMVVRERCVKAWARAMAVLLAQPELRRRMGEQARIRWENYRPEVFIARLVDSFYRCIKSFESFFPNAREGPCARG
jgi:glycosyltransferase involved in cell wall biosynthesis